MLLILILKLETNSENFNIYTERVYFTNISLCKSHNPSNTSSYISPGREYEERYLIYDKTKYNIFAKQFF